MSIPRAKTPSSDAPTSRIPTDSNAAEKPSKALPRKSIPVVSAKSKIPKQDKNPAPSVITDDTSSIASTIKKDERQTPSKARPTSKSQDKPPAVSSSRPKMSMSVSSVFNQKRNLENKFSIMKKKYISMKADIEDKQKSIEPAFEELLLLREKVLATGGKDPGSLDELAPVPIWSNRPRIGDQPGSARSTHQKTNSQDKEFIVHLESMLKKMPDTFLAFCEEVMDKMSNVITWIAEFEQEAKDEPTPIKDEMASQIEFHKSETEELRERLQMIRQEELGSVGEIVKGVSCLWYECQAFRKEREEGKNSTLSAMDETTEELTKELHSERDKLSKLRVKIRDQESAISSLEKKLKEAQDHVKQLEQQLKQKEATLESRTKELSKYQKNNDHVIVKLEKQKDHISNKASKLEKELASKKSEAEELAKRVEALEQELATERKAKEEYELQYEAFDQRNKKLEEKCKQLLEVQDKKAEIIDDHHTDYDIQLLNDLKATQKLLEEKEEIIKKLQIEREEIMAAVNEADQENDSSKDRLSAELIKRSNELEATRSQFVQLQKNYKRLQQKTEHLETKLHDMTRVHAQLKDGTKTAYTTQLMLLQQQLTDARGSLGDATSRNDELQKLCSSLQLKIEKYKRYLTNHDSNIRVRREIQLLLQNKVEADGIDKAKFASVSYDEYQKMYEELEQKELQILKLESLVKQMEKQEEYAQTQRTRLESRIASLEVTLKETEQTHRNRGFSFL